MTEQISARAALNNLRNQVGGAMVAFECGMRGAIGNTNYACIEDAIALADIALRAPPALPAREIAEENDAALWRALLSSQRIRPLGWAGMDKDGKPKLDGRDYMHFGMEVWSKHSDHASLAEEKALGVTIITNYADELRRLAPDPAPKAEGEK